MRTILECVFHGLFKAIEHIPKQEKYLLRHATCNMCYYMKELYEFQKYPFFSQAHGENQWSSLCIHASQPNAA